MIKDRFTFDDVFEFLFINKRGLISKFFTDSGNFLFNDFAAKFRSTLTQVLGNFDEGGGLKIVN